MKIRCLLSALLAVAGSATAAGPGGHFRYGDVKMEIRHAYAVPDTDPERTGGVLVFLTSVPVDAREVAEAFDAGNAVDQQLVGKPGGYVRVCIDAEGAECGLYFSHNEPLASFNLSGSGVFKLANRSDRRIDGSWVQAEPEEFFDKTYDFDLRFAVDVTRPPPGTPAAMSSVSPVCADMILLPCPHPLRLGT